MAFDFLAIDISVLIATVASLYPVKFMQTKGSPCSRACTLHILKSTFAQQILCKHKFWLGSFNKFMVICQTCQLFHPPKFPSVRYPICVCKNFIVFIIHCLFYMVCFSFITMDIQNVSCLCNCVSIANLYTLN